MNIFKKAANKVGDFIRDPIGKVEDLFGAKNKFTPPDITTDPSLGAALLADRARSGGIYGQQQQFGSYLQNQAMGGAAPNPALSMYQDTVAQNIQNAQAQIASAKGVNRAQAARLGSDAALQANQQAARQASTIRAQQQLGAQDQYGQFLGGLGAQGLQQQGINQTALAQQNAAQNTRAGIQAGVAGQNAQVGAGLLGGMLNGLGAGSSLAGMGGGGGGAGAVPPVPAWTGGRIGAYADGGSVGEFESLDQGLMGSDQWFHGPTPNAAPQPTPPAQPTGGGGSSSLKNLGQGSLDTMLRFMQLGKGMASGGPVPPGMPESRLGQMVAGLYTGGGAPSLESGGSVGGRPVVSGDSPKNDRVPAVLSPGEIVIPRSHAGSPEAAADFVRALQARGYAEGGEVAAERPSFGDAVRRWWDARSESASHDVADALHSALPDWMSARSAVKKNQARRDSAYEASKD